MSAGYSRAQHFAFMRTGTLAVPASSHYARRGRSVSVTCDCCGGNNLIACIAVGMDGFTQTFDYCMLCVHSLALEFGRAQPHHVPVHPGVSIEPRDQWMATYHYTPVPHGYSHEHTVMTQPFTGVSPQCVDFTGNTPNSEIAVPQATRPIDPSDGRTVSPAPPRPGLPKYSSGLNRPKIQKTD